MRTRMSTALVIVVLCVAPVTWADLAPYGQDFEGLAPAPQELPATSLGEDGWLGYVNVFGPDWNRWYGYGPFPAPNHGAVISAVVTEQGGPEQGDQQLSVFSDYWNGDHANGAWIEVNVFQEQVIGAADVGDTWRFEFDAKRGNIDGSSMAAGFIKTLNPAAGYAMTNFIQADMTYIPDTWGGYSIDIEIDPSLEGQILQFGFVNWATAYQGSGIYYDNVNFDVAPLSVGLDIRPEGCPNPITSSRGLLPVALLGAADFDVSLVDVDTLRLEGLAPFLSAYEDVASPFTGDLCGCTDVGPDGFIDLALKFKTQDILAAIESSGGSQVLTLTGALLDGTRIEGQDCIVFVGRISVPRTTRPTLVRLPVSGDSPRADVVQFGSISGTD